MPGMMEGKVAVVTGAGGGFGREIAIMMAKAGAKVIEPSCGACINAGPGVSTRPDQVVISAQNRNFPGRSGPGQMYLASPLTVAASAVAGYIVEYEPAGDREIMRA